MNNKYKKKVRFTLSFLLAAFLGFGITSCGENNNPTSNQSSQESTSEKVTSNEEESSVTSSINQNVENSVKIKSIDVDEYVVEPVNVKSRYKKELNDANEDIYNYVIVTRDVTDVKFTIKLDNPEAFGIDALRVSCDDPEAQIQVEGEWKPIAQDSNGTRVVNWSSEDPYEKSYNIRTTSLENLCKFKIVDIRLAGHETFLSKQTDSTDFGNNELNIYKIDNDAFELDVINNTFEEIKFKINIKEGITNLSNFKVNGENPNNEGYWVINENIYNCEISYDFELENGTIVNRIDYTDIELLNVNLGIKNNDWGKPHSPYYLFLAGDQCGWTYLDFGSHDEWVKNINTKGYFEIYMLISGTGGIIIPEMWVGDIKLENVKYGSTGGLEIPYIYYCIMPELDFLNEDKGYDIDMFEYMIENFRFKVNNKTYKVLCNSSGCAIGYEEVIGEDVIVSIDEIKLKKSMDSIVNLIPDSIELKDQISLPTSAVQFGYEDVKYAWSVVEGSSTFEIEGGKLKVKFVNTPVAGKIKVVATLNGKMIEHVFDVTAKIPTIISISKFIEDKTNNQYLRGIVVAAGGDSDYAGSFVLADETGVIFSYNKFKVNVGDEIIINTDYSEYNGVVQSATTKVVEVVSTGNDISKYCTNPVVKTAAEMKTLIEAAETGADLYEAYGQKCLKVSGVLVRNSSGYCSLYVNEGDSKYVLNFYTNDAVNDLVDAVLGTDGEGSANVVVTGFVRGVKAGEGGYLIVQLNNVVAA